MVSADNILTLALYAWSFIPPSATPPTLSEFYILEESLPKGEVKVISRGAKRKSKGRLVARKGKIGPIVKGRKEHQKAF